MQFALLHRFQGALLGAMLGEWLGQSGQQGFAKPHGQSLTTLPLSSLPLPISDLMWHSAQILAEPGATWPDRNGSGAPLLATWSTSAAAIGLLPVALFFHDADWQLAAQLQTATATWQNPQLALTGLTLVGRAIALLLREQFTPLEMIPWLLHAGAPTGWHPPLAQVQTQLAQTAGLQATQQSVAQCSPLPSEASAIALAFYCFLSTPTTFELSLHRALRLGLPPSALALVGALSGTHNSLSGLPIGWRLAATSTPLAPVQPLALADRLLANWAGAYHPPAFSAAALTTAIAAPQVIRQVGQREVRRARQGGT
jgi:hypothetical protein